MASESVPLGPTGRRLAANVEPLRRERGLNQPELAKRMNDHGRAVHPTAISKIERLTRRVDVDDLVALALALGVTPNRLLLPAAADATPVQLTSEVSDTASHAWQWARGLKPLPDDLQQAASTGEENYPLLWARFIRENAPRGSEVDMEFDPVLLYQAAWGEDTKTHATHRVLSVLKTALWAGLNADALKHLVDAAAAMHDAE